ncbi:MAG: DNA mismatch repair protein MutS, partial [Bacteroidota bacterium]
MPGKKFSTQLNSTGETRLIQQYNQLKAKHPGALLLCRVGDFYEAFGEDARKLSEIAEIVLTKYANGNAAAVDMAGFPYHALDTYIPKLIKAGLRVAITNQPKEASQKGLIQRDVVELVTPGLSYHDQVLEKKQNNYLASLHFGPKLLGIAFLDVSTGEFVIAEGGQSYIEKLLQSFSPSEVIFNKAEKKAFQKAFQDEYHHYALEDWIYHFEYGYDQLNAHFKTNSLKGFGIANLKMGIIAAGAVLQYLNETKHEHLTHINSIARLEEEKYLWLDKFTIRNLELLRPQQEDGVSLIDILDQTVTPMGARMIRRWVILPLKELVPIQKRLDAVGVLVANGQLASHILASLKQIGDIERLISKVAAKRINPRELLALKKALAHTLPIQKLLKQSGHEQLTELGKQINTCDFILEKISKTLQPNPPILTNQGNLIQPGVHQELDELHRIVFEGKDYLQQLLEKARHETGISSLKIGYNKVFGFYLEVTNTHKEKVPNSWIRKQTMVNAERYITEELKGYEEKILFAQEKMYTLEYNIYYALIESTEAFVPHIQENAKILAQIDCYVSFATQA